jgi:hypothetical protein
MARDQACASARREAVLKRDLFGAVELWTTSAGERFVLRRPIAAAEARAEGIPGPLRPFGRAVGALLARRERRTLERLAACVARDPALAARLAGRLPQAVPGAWLAAARDAVLAESTPLCRKGRAACLPAGEWVGRSFLPGEPLDRTPLLSRRYFEHLEALLATLHGLGLRHNDLHKEQNLLVLPDGSPGLIDFQLSSWHFGSGRMARVRAAEDLRHVRKIARRYLQRDPERTARLPEVGRRSLLAALWMRCGKPVYKALTRGLLGWRDGERGRPPGGAFPRWVD